MKIFEGLDYEDMKGLIESEIQIDRHKPKVGAEEDVVVLAITVLYEEPAKELGNFIETGNILNLDVEVSSTPTETGQYLVFIEFQRDQELWDKIDGLLRDLDQITSKHEGEWKYIAYRTKGEAKPFTEENFKADVATTPEEYLERYTQKDDSVDESLERLKRLITY